MINTRYAFYAILAKKYNIPEPVIEVICNSPFKFIKDHMSECDSKPFMLTYLFKIKLKKKYNTKSNDQGTKESN